MNREIAYLDSLQGSGIRPGLARMRTFLRAAGHPEKSFPSILVAGTNGKGSTAATVASIVGAGGYRCGLYTSPHLVDLRERWMINGEKVQPHALRDAIRELRALASRVATKPTYFEALTVLAFLLFRALECELAVLEVGMGGRLDATNVVRPLLSLITSISIDHTDFLGTTVRQIAREKAGVIHRGCVALTSATHPQALEVIRQRCKKTGVPLHIVFEQTRATDMGMNAEGIRFSLRTTADTYRLQSPLVGLHQIDNVSLAVRAVEELRGHFPDLSRDVISTGVSGTRWRGRLERFSVDHKTIWVDGGHNTEAAERIAAFVRTHLPAPRCLVFGILRDKEVEKVGSILFPEFDELILTQPPSERAQPIGQLGEIAGALGRPYRAAKRPADAFRLALAAKAGSVLVCGSLYLAGDAVRFFDRLRARFGTRRFLTQSLKPERVPRPRVVAVSGTR